MSHISHQHIFVITYNFFYHPLTFIDDIKIKFHRVDTANVRQGQGT